MALRGQRGDGWHGDGTGTPFTVDRDDFVSAGTQLCVFVCFEYPAPLGRTRGQIV